MKVKVLREFYGDKGEARAGDELTVTRTTGNELKARGLVEIIDESEEEDAMQEDPSQKKAEAPANKAAPEPANKADRASANKSAASSEAK